MDPFIDPLLGFALQNLKELVMYNYDLVCRAKENVGKLRDDLDIMEGFIEWCAKTRNNGNSDIFFQTLIAKVRKVSYNAEDVIERYIVTASLQKDRDKLGRFLHFVDYGYGLRRVAKQIEGISEDINKVYEKQAHLMIAAMQGNANREKEQKKKVDVVVEEDDMVGFDDALEEVINLLTGESEMLEIISIVGMPGLGKTMLAKKVISNPIIRYRFPTCAFINVSQDHDIKQVFLKILCTLPPIPEAVNYMSADQLAQVIQERLKSKKYLFVIDDVGTPQAWENVKRAFPNNRGSMVLITSRDDRVASCANPSSDPYRLRFLTIEESRELLSKRVFGKKSCPEKVIEHELKIAKKCGGFPLKVILVASILQDDKERTEWWAKVAEGEYPYVESDVIRMCYENLPFHLKPCFLYFGVFHEDVAIPVSKLLRLWVAEGFLQQDGNKKMSLEDSAYSYLRDLVKRNLVMVEQKRADGQIKTCRIHDSLREFCRQQAMKENLFQEITRYDQAFLSTDALKFNCRRLFVNSHAKDYISAIPSGMPVRSFLCFAKEEVTLDSKQVSSIPKVFQLLRVLDVRSIKFPHFPDELPNLVLLKYISISCDSNTLPEKVSRLQNLQMLIVHTESPTIIIKADIWKMSKLMHLYTNACTFLPSPPSKKQQHLPHSNLQTLSTISPESCGNTNVLQRTPNIKKLGVRGELETSMFDTVSSLEFIENLKLINESKHSKLLALPLRNNSLRKLTLQNAMLDWKHMSTLGMLNNLVVLKLKDNAFRGERWQTDDDGFPRLEVLHIGKTNLVEWKASKDSFPLLSHLSIRDCSELKEIPPAFGHITSLQKIVLHDTNSLVASSAMKIQLRKLGVQKMPKTPKTGGFQLSVKPSEHLGSGSTNQQYQPDPQIAKGKELQAIEISHETLEASKKELQRTEVSQESNEFRGKDLKEVKVPEEAKNKNELPVIKVPEEPKASRQNKLQQTEVQPKPKKCSVMQVIKKFFHKSDKGSKGNEQHMENNNKKIADQELPPVN